MEYKNIKQAKFIDRPNRFIANIEIDKKIDVCHVKNTGRCKELLLYNADIFVQEADNSVRKTKYDLISVYKRNKLINMDSQVPNKVFKEWALSSELFKNAIIKQEKTYKRSRFDFYIEIDDRKIFVEVKGVTLEVDDVALFPDAPTERGVKHINELCECINDGYEAYIVFIIQMKGVKYFKPNINTHKEFAQALIKARDVGVNILAIDCEITKTTISHGDFVEVML